MSKHWISCKSPTNYVYSKAWGVGHVVAKIGSDCVTADFGGKLYSFKYSHYHTKTDKYHITYIRSATCLDYLLKRGVTHLVHFTAISNIPSILDIGISPRANLPDSALTSDTMRLDRNVDCSCFSISYPNYRMLYRKQMDTKERYAVLYIDIHVLASIDSEKISYFASNAADSTMAGKKESGLDSLTQLFKDQVVKCKGGEKYIFDRKREHLKPKYTTDPQAEVQIQDIIKPEYITEIEVQTTDYDLLLRVLNSRTIPIKQTTKFWPTEMWSSYNEWEKNRRKS